MAVERKGKSITMTADADAYTGTTWINGITFQCTGASAGDRLRLTDTQGSIVADYRVSAAADNVDLWGGRIPQHFVGLLVEDFPSGGAGVLTVFLD